MKYTPYEAKRELRKLKHLLESDIPNHTGRDLAPIILSIKNLKESSGPMCLTAGLLEAATNAYYNAVKLALAPISVASAAFDRTIDDKILRVQDLLELPADIAYFGIKYMKSGGR